MLEENLAARATLAGPYLAYLKSRLGEVHYSLGDQHLKIVADRRQPNTWRKARSRYLPPPTDWPEILQAAAPKRRVGAIEDSTRTLARALTYITSTLIKEAFSWQST